MLCNGAVVRGGGEISRIKSATKKCGSMLLALREWLVSNYIKFEWPLILASVKIMWFIRSCLGSTYNDCLPG